jgi:hypothetical protein
VLSRADLDRQLPGARSSGLELEELHWLINARVAAIVSRSGDEREDYLVIFERGRIVRRPSFAPTRT